MNNNVMNEMHKIEEKLREEIKREIQIALETKRRSRTRNLIIIAIMAAGLPLAIYASSLTIPNTFASGAPLSSAAMNANFTAAKAAIDDNNTRIGTLETASTNYNSRLNALEANIPTGTMAFYTTAACPSGWTQYSAANGRYIVAAAGSVTNTSGTALSNLEARTVGQHYHSIDPANTSVSISDPGHTHSTPGGNQFLTYNVGGTNGPTAAGSPKVTLNDANAVISNGATGITASVDIAAFNSADSGSVAGTNAPYIQLYACRKN